MAEPTVRFLTAADASAYRALMLEAYDRHPTAFTSSVDERAGLPLAWWERRLGAAGGADELACGVWQGDALMGALGLSFETRRKARHKASLFGMYVREEARRHRLARRLVAAALGEAVARPHVLVVQLTVSEGNAAALALYDSCGFTAFGREPLGIAVDGLFVAKVHMWMRLRPLAPNVDADPSAPARA